MAKISPLNISDYASFTAYPLNNITQILAYSRLSMDIYMQWQPLYREVATIVGSRCAYLYAFAISVTSESAFYADFFRDIIITNGEDPDNLVLSDTEQDLCSFGAAITENNGHIEDVTFDNLIGHYTNKELVILVAFAGQMTAANVFNNVLGIYSDDF